MQVGALSFRPYIYNTNMLSGSSLSRVSSIGDDLLTSKTDYSALTDESLNVNPLRKGQSVNFVDILEMQMQMGRMNASRIMKPNEDENLQMIGNTIAEEPLQSKETEKIVDTTVIVKNDVAVEDFEPVSGNEGMQNMQFDRNLFMMQRAAEAYRVNMIA